MNVRLAVGILVLLAVLGGYAGFLELRKAPASTPTEPFFYQINENDIARVEVTHLGKTERFMWDGGTQQWVFDDGYDTPISLDRWGGIPLLLSGPRVDRVLAAHVSNPARYGLDFPSTTIKVTITDGQALTVLLGGATPDGQNVYAMLQGSSVLVLVNSSWADVLNKLVTDPPYASTPTPSPG